MMLATRLILVFFTVAILHGSTLAQSDPLPERLLEEPAVLSNEGLLTETPQLRPNAARGVAGGPSGLMGSGPPGYEVTWYPSRPVRNQATDLGLVRQSLAIGAPIWRDGGRMLMARFSVRHSLVSTDAILPETGRHFPEQLWNVNFGLNYMHQFDNGWSGMLITGLGSPSDKPFHSIREVNATVGGILRIPVVNGRDNWQLGLMYMSGGAVDFPLPVVAYGWNPSERFRMNIGLPFSVFWQPTDDLDFTLSYVPLLTISTRINYRLTPDVRLYGGYEFLNESYFLADRLERRDRFFDLEQRLFTGLRWQFSPNGSLDVSGGYAFGRRFGEGRNQWGTLRDRVDVQSGAYASLRIGLHF